MYSSGGIPHGKCDLLVICVPEKEISQCRFDFFRHCYAGFHPRAPPAIDSHCQCSTEHSDGLCPIHSFVCSKIASLLRGYSRRSECFPLAHDRFEDGSRMEQLTGSLSEWEVLM